MDNLSAQQVIAAIERLSNRIAKLDETSVESAAIANETRRAAMDAAEATNPKQIAGYIERCVTPPLENLQRDQEKMYHEFKNGAWSAMHDAAEAKKLFEKNSSRLLTEIDDFQDEKLWWRFKTFGFAMLTVGAINLAIWAVR